MREEYSIQALCRNLKVSTSGYYGWLGRQEAPGARAKADRELMQEVKTIHERSRSTYGSPRVLAELCKRGKCHGRNRVARLMKTQGLCGRQKGRWRVKTTDSNHDHPIAPNRLKERAQPSAPNQVWVGDITYIKSTQGWLYLAAIMDIYSRKIVGWAISERIDTALILRAWDMAILHRRPPNGLIFHSDRGVQYASSAHRAALREANVVASMSRKANCYDNAAMEAFWSTLKLELIYRQPEAFQTTGLAQSTIFDDIEIFYNRQRLHSSLDYLSPAEFEVAKN